MQGTKRNLVLGSRLHDVDVEAEFGAAVTVKAVPLTEDVPIQDAAGSVCCDDDRVQPMSGTNGSVAVACRLGKHCNV